jgi:SAM-dependent methyltransferase
MDLVEPNFTFEDSTWYGSIRAKVIELILRPKVVDRSGLKILDFGCGNGETLRFLNQRLSADIEYIGYDPNLLNSSQEENGIILVNEIQDYVDTKFDCVLLMDVLEHVSSPIEILNQAYSMLAPGGQLVVTVPAYRWAWSPHDDALGHYDRYTKTRLMGLVSRLNDVNRVNSGYLFPTIFLLSLPFKVLKLSKNSLKASQKFAWLLERIGKAEAALGARSCFGISVISIVERVA